MSTNSVPGAKAVNNDVLAMGCWAEHNDGSMILVEGVEAGTVVYSVFDLAPDPPVEYRDAMPEKGFKTQYSWPNAAGIQWTWHDKTPFPWDRVMASFPAGQKHVSAEAQMTAAQRVAESLNLRGETARQRAENDPAVQRAARTIMSGIMEAIHAVRR